MVKTVLVAVDSSEFAWRVIDALGILHLEPNCLIVLAHIIAPPPPESIVAADVPHIPDEEYEEFRDTEVWLGELSSDVPYTTTFEIVTGDAAEEIVRLAGIHKSDLIVLGSRGLKGMSRVIHGSVSSQVVADAPCSVMVVRQ